MDKENNIQHEGENDANLAMELNYQELIDLMNSTSCMTICSDKVDMYQRIETRFYELLGYKNSDELAGKCKQLANQVSEEIKSMYYEKARNRMKIAKSAQDYLTAAEEFREASGYRDADQMALECKKQSSSIGKKGEQKKILKIAVAVLCLITIMYGSTTSHAKYYLANTYALTGSYNSAIKMYKKLGPYKDCLDRLVECEYRSGLYLQSKGEYKKAIDTFEEAGSYKDSENRKVEMEKSVIQNSKVGDTVKVGGHTWIILEVRDGQALLMVKSALKGMPYNKESGDVTWETSSLRQWLNSEFLDKTFSESERACIVLSNVENSNNREYGTEGGSDTKDYVFLLSGDEVQKYRSLFPVFQRNSWLRSPGYNQNSAEFLSVNGGVMDFGYVTTSDEFLVRPVMWFK